MVGKHPKTFEEFWPRYLKDHLNPTNRALHFIGTSLAYVCIALGLVSSIRWLALAPLVGYGFAWTGHFLVERNRPATFTHPLWSLRGDLRMHARILSGSLTLELDRLRRSMTA